MLPLDLSEEECLILFEEMGGRNSPLVYRMLQSPDKITIEEILVIINSLYAEHPTLLFKIISEKLSHQEIKTLFAQADNSMPQYTYLSQKFRYKPEVYVYQILIETLGNMPDFFNFVTSQDGDFYLLGEMIQFNYLTNKIMELLSADCRYVQLFQESVSRFIGPRTNCETVGMLYNPLEKNICH